MGKRVGFAAALVICPFILAACGFGGQPHGLPAPPGDADCPAFVSQIPHGPACRDVKRFQFQEAGQDTEVDLERPRKGGINDLSYDHFTGELKPIHGARVSLYRQDGGWWGGGPDKRSDYPSEELCRNRRAVGQNVFSKDALKAEFSIFCIETAENHDGFLFVTPIADQKPDAYTVYTYIWIR